MNTETPIPTITNNGVTPEGRVLANITGANPVLAQKAIDNGTINRVTVGRVQMIG